MRDTSQLKKENAEVYYRDKVGQRYEYVKGQVLEHKTVEKASKEWDQKWSRTAGTILKIAPKDSRVENKIRYRHMSSVLSAEQYKGRRKVGTRAKQRTQSSTASSGSKKKGKTSP